METGDITFKVSHARTLVPLRLAPGTTLAELRAAVHELTGVEPEQQTALIFKGKTVTASADPAATITDLGINRRSKVVVMGTKRVDVEAMWKGEAADSRRHEARKRAREQRPLYGKNQNAGPSTPYVFQSRRVLENMPAGAPSPAEARAYLQRICDDNGVRAIMEKHKWTVGLLSEFAPSMQTGLVGVTGGCLLGFNRNRGQEISLRLRTDDFMGFRHYHVIMKTVLHELCHMVHDEHETPFWTLFSRVSKEYKELDWEKQGGGHTIGTGLGLMQDDMPNDPGGFMASAPQQLGGGGGGGASAAEMAHSAALMRREAVPPAAVKDLDDAGGCGCGASNHGHPVPAGCVEAKGREDSALMDLSTVVVPPAAAESVVEAAAAAAAAAAVVAVEDMEVSSQSPTPGNSTAVRQAAGPTADVRSSVATPPGAAREETPMAVTPSGDAPTPMETTATPAADASVAASSMDTSEQVEQITEMGFTSEQATRALRVAFGNSASAVEYLMNSSAVTSAATQALGPTPTAAATTVALAELVADLEQSGCSAKELDIGRAVQTLQATGHPGSSVQCIAILGKIVKNIRSHPGEQKYRSIKLENPTFRGATQGCHTEAVAFLQHVGFILSEDSAQLVYTRNDPGLLWLADSLLGAASR